MIDILLSACNGERYLPELSESLRAQSEGSFTVLLRDDGSHDATPRLLQRLTETDSRFRLLPGTPFHAVSRSFFELLSHSGAPYCMFCDQDDRWHAGKVEKTLAAMRAAQARYGADTPLLVHTDLAVTDAELRPVSPSMMRSQALHPQRAGLARLLCQSLVSGCTMMLNAPLRALILRHLPEDCLMYDWWISLAAAAFGQVVYLDEPTLDYRQHGDNIVGAQDALSAAYLLRRLRDGAGTRQALQGTYEQAAAFAAAFREELPEQALRLVESYAALPERGYAARRWQALRLGTVKCGARALGQLWYM